MMSSRPLILSRTPVILSAVSLSCSLWMACDGEPRVSTTGAASSTPQTAATVVAAPRSLTPTAPTRAVQPPAPNTKATKTPTASLSTEVEGAEVAAAKDATAAREVEVRGEPVSLYVKRLVVTKKVENREPTQSSTLDTAGGIIAFVELENSGGADQDVIITFERSHAADSVGHVKLTVPAKKERWRTWARTQNIKGPGTWEAVVSSTDGVELARASFEVTG